MVNLSEYHRWLKDRAEESVEYSSLRRDELLSKDFDIRGMNQRLSSLGLRLSSNPTQADLLVLLKKLIKIEGVRDLWRDLMDLSTAMDERERDSDHIEKSTQREVKKLLETTRKSAEKIEKIVSSAVRRVKTWPGYKIEIKPILPWDKRSGDWLTPPQTFTVYFNDLSFTMLGGRHVEDVLEGGDLDFFQSPTETKAYFDLINEIRSPGSSSKGRNLKLYTARPVKDRARYENAKTLPPNLFLSSSYARVEGISRDMRGRDVYLVVINSQYLVQTLDSPSAKDYQIVGDEPVPIRRIELV